MTLDHDNPVKKSEFCKRSQISLSSALVELSQRASDNTKAFVLCYKWLKHSLLSSLKEPKSVLLKCDQKVEPRENGNRFFLRSHSQFFSREVSVLFPVHFSSNGGLSPLSVHTTVKSSDLLAKGEADLEPFAFTMRLTRTTTQPYRKTARFTSEGSKYCLSVHICTQNAESGFRARFGGYKGDRA